MKKLLLKLKLKFAAKRKKNGAEAFFGDGDAMFCFFYFCTRVSTNILYNILYNYIITVLYYYTDIF